MSAPGLTTELYSDPTNPSSTLGAPPAVSSTTPAPVVVVNQPVAVKSRMADESTDGRVRDTSMEAVTQPSRDLHFRNITDESENAPKPPAAVEKPIEASKEPVAPAEAAKPAEPAAERVYAGKFKTADELEKSYVELQSRSTKAMQEAADLRKAAEQRSLATPSTPAVKSAEQVAAEATERDQILSDLVANPKKFMDDIQRRAVEQTQLALAAQQLTHDWKIANPDLAEHESRVAFEAALLTQSDPELARDPAALFSKATEQFRAFTGKLRTEGAKAALTQETRVIPLLQSSQLPAATEQPQKAPLSADDAYAQHMQMLKAQESRSHRGLRR